MQIIRPTEKIEIIESKKQCKAGSTGYLAYQQPLDKYNLCRSAVVFTKFGNKGKNRIEIINIITELVDIKSMKLTEKGRNKLKESATEYGIIPRHPDKYYNIDSSMKKIPISSKNIINLDMWDFFGYICSLSLFIKKVSNDLNVMPSMFTAGKLSPEEVVQTHIVDIPPITLVDFIYLALNDSKLHRFDYDKEALLSSYLKYFKNANNRMLCMDKMYLFLSSLREGVLRYSKYMISSHKEMSSRIKAVASNKKSSGGKLKVDFSEFSKVKAPIYKYNREPDSNQTARIREGARYQPSRDGDTRTDAQADLRTAAQAEPGMRTFRHYADENQPMPDPVDPSRHRGHRSNPRANPMAYDAGQDAEDIAEVPVDMAADIRRERPATLMTAENTRPRERTVEVNTEGLNADDLLDGTWTIEHGD